MPTPRTSKPSRIETTGTPRLYKRIGVRKVSFFYQYPDGRRETFTTAPIGDREAIKTASNKARRQAIDTMEGAVVVGTVAEMIDRFDEDVAPTHFLDQSKDGIAVRKSTYKKLKAFFGKMAPRSLKTLHGYQFLTARAKDGAPAKANKELSLFSTICNYAVRNGSIDANPFIGIMQNKTDRDVRTTTRQQVVRFYLWSLKQKPVFRNVGCAAMFTYLTGFRAAEVRPFRMSGLTPEGVRVLGAKRKKGEEKTMKLRTWSPRLRAVVARAKQTHVVERLYLFANSTGKPYTRSGWGTALEDAMFAWIATLDPEAAAALDAKQKWDARRRVDKRNGKEIGKFESTYTLTESEHYFALSDVRPAGITTKLRNRDADSYDFAAHANPATTHRHYDRRKVKVASPTE